MFRFKRPTTVTAGVEFCESCSQVCTRACRARAHRDRVHAGASMWTSALR